MTNYSFNFDQIRSDFSGFTAKLRSAFARDSLSFFLALTFTLHSVFLSLSHTHCVSDFDNLICMDSQCVTQWLQCTSAEHPWMLLLCHVALRNLFFFFWCIFSLNADEAVSFVELRVFNHMLMLAITSIWSVSRRCTGVLMRACQDV